jgi:hypothetical protein
MPLAFNAFSMSIPARSTCVPIKPARHCAAVNDAGDGAYGKWLNTTTDPEYIIPC